MNISKAVSLGGAVLGLLGVVIAASMGWETWAQASPVILVALGILGVHPNLQ